MKEAHIQKAETNKQGAELAEAMNSTEMVILNDVRSKSQYTNDYREREAKSIVDFIVVSESMFKVVSDITCIDCREKLETDHVMVSVEVEHKKETQP